ncbi:unnamed protein product [Amoebophrya sp. A120]|nr:unnamed protein product [Amoebophrya sp. A120]|eukprot:GSA120T00000926001.1
MQTPPSKKTTVAPVQAALYRLLLRTARRIDRDPVARVFVLAPPKKFWMHESARTYKFQDTVPAFHVLTRLLKRANNDGEFFLPPPPPKESRSTALEEVLSKHDQGGNREDQHHKLGDVKQVELLRQKLSSPLQPSYFSAQLPYLLTRAVKHVRADLVSQQDAFETIKYFNFVLNLTSSFSPFSSTKLPSSSRIVASTARVRQQGAKYHIVDHEDVVSDQPGGEVGHLGPTNDLRKNSGRRGAPVRRRRSSDQVNLLEDQQDGTSGPVPRPTNGKIDGDAARGDEQESSYTAAQVEGEEAPAATQNDPKTEVRDPPELQRRKNDRNVKTVVDAIDQNVSQMLQGTDMAALFEQGRSNKNGEDHSSSGSRDHGETGTNSKALYAAIAQLELVGDQVYGKFARTSKKNTKSTTTTNESEPLPSRSADSIAAELKRKQSTRDHDHLHAEQSPVGSKTADGQTEKDLEHGTSTSATTSSASSTSGDHSASKTPGDSGGEDENAANEEEKPIKRTTGLGYSRAAPASSPTGFSGDSAFPEDSTALDRGIAELLWRERPWPSDSAGSLLSRRNKNALGDTAGPPGSPNNGGGSGSKGQKTTASANAENKSTSNVRGGTSSLADTEISGTTTNTGDLNATFSGGPCSSDETAIGASPDREDAGSTSKEKAQEQQQPNAEPRTLVLSKDDPAWEKAFWELLHPGCTVEGLRAAETRAQSRGFLERVIPSSVRIVPIREDVRKIESKEELDVFLDSKLLRPSARNRKGATSSTNNRENKSPAPTNKSGKKTSHTQNTTPHQRVRFEIPVGELQQTSSSRKISSEQNGKNLKEPPARPHLQSESFSSSSTPSKSGSDRKNAATSSRSTTSTIPGREENQNDPEVTTETLTSTTPSSKRTSVYDFASKEEVDRFLDRLERRRTGTKGKARTTGSTAATTSGTTSASSSAPGGKNKNIATSAGTDDVTKTSGMKATPEHHSNNGMKSALAPGGEVAAPLTKEDVERELDRLLLQRKNRTLQRQQIVATRLLRAIAEKLHRDVDNASEGRSVLLEGNAVGTGAIFPPPGGRKHKLAHQRRQAFKGVHLHKTTTGNYGNSMEEDNRGGNANESLREDKQQDHGLEENQATDQGGVAIPPGAGAPSATLVGQQVENKLLSDHEHGPPRADKNADENDKAPAPPASSAASPGGSDADSAGGSATSEGATTPSLVGVVSAHTSTGSSSGMNNCNSTSEETTTSSSSTPATAASTATSTTTSTSYHSRAGSPTSTDKPRNKSSNPLLLQNTKQFLQLLEEYIFSEYNFLAEGIFHNEDNSTSDSTSSSKQNSTTRKVTTTRWLNDKKTKTNSKGKADEPVPMLDDPSPELPVVPELNKNAFSLRETADVYELLFPEEKHAQIQRVVGEKELFLPKFTKFLEMRLPKKAWDGVGGGLFHGAAASSARVNNKSAEEGNPSAQRAEGVEPGQELQSQTPQHIEGAVGASSGPAPTAPPPPASSPAPVVLSPTQQQQLVQVLLARTAARDRYFRGFASLPMLETSSNGDYRTAMEDGQHQLPGAQDHAAAFHEQLEQLQEQIEDLDQHLFDNAALRGGSSFDFHDLDTPLAEEFFSEQALDAQLAELDLEFSDLLDSDDVYIDLRTERDLQSTHQDVDHTWLDEWSSSSSTPAGSVSQSSDHLLVPPPPTAAQPDLPSDNTTKDDATTRAASTAPPSDSEQKDCTSEGPVAGAPGRGVSPSLKPSGPQDQKQDKQEVESSFSVRQPTEGTRTELPRKNAESASGGGGKIASSSPASNSISDHHDPQGLVGEISTNIKGRSRTTSSGVNNTSSTEFLLRNKNKKVVLYPNRIEPGTVLIGHPLGPYFQRNLHRSVIVITENSEEQCAGLILNKPFYPPTGGSSHNSALSRTTEKGRSSAAASGTRQSMNGGKLAEFLHTFGTPAVPSVDKENLMSFQEDKSYGVDRVTGESDGGAGRSSEIPQDLLPLTLEEVLRVAHDLQESEKNQQLFRSTTSSSTATSTNGAEVGGQILSTPLSLADRAGTNSTRRERHARHLFRALESFPFHRGGDCEHKQKVQILHDCENVAGAIRLHDGLYLDGNVQEIVERSGCYDLLNDDPHSAATTTHDCKNINNNSRNPNVHVHLFGGTCLWAKGQLETELERNLWLPYPRRKTQQNKNMYYLLSCLYYSGVCKSFVRQRRLHLHSPRYFFFFFACKMRSVLCIFNASDKMDWRWEPRKFLMLARQQA